MRPIDADALLKAIIQMPLDGNVFDRIHEAPTIETERTGNWVDDDGNVIKIRGGYCATCSACGEWSEYLTAYCPNCGAKMKNYEEDTNV